MRWHCTVESAENKEFSLLALLESLFAVSLSLGIAFWYDYWWHIVIASCLAPFLLLRTDESTRKGLQTFNKIWEKLDPTSNIVLSVFLGVAIIGWLLSIYSSSTVMFVWFFLGSIGLLISWLAESKTIKFYKLPLYLQIIMIVAIVVVAVFVVVGGIVVVVGVIVVGVVGGVVGGSLVSKTLAVLNTCIKNFWRSLKAIPGNWYRIVFCVDICHPPELVPGVEGEKYRELAEGLSDLQFGRWVFGIGSSLKERDSSEKLIGLLLVLLTPILYLPALVYRWSLKSSSIVWLPLIWLIREEKKGEDYPDDNTWLTVRLKQEYKTVTAIFQFIYSLIVRALFWLIRAEKRGEDYSDDNTWLTARLK